MFNRKEENKYYYVNGKFRTEAEKIRDLYRRLDSIANNLKLEWVDEEKTTRKVGYFKAGKEN